MIYLNSQITAVIEIWRKEPIFSREENIALSLDITFIML